MNLTNFAAVNLVAPPEPPPPPARPEDEARTHADRSDRDRDDAFDRALKQEMERKALQAAPPTNPIYMPFMQQPAAVVATESDAISGVSATSAISSAFALSALSSATASSSAGAEADATPAPAPVERPAEPAAEPVAIVVEPGLPPVQPTTEAGAKVSLVDFPQVVVGQIRHAVRDNKPLTQLDFQISPPHVGPVNLSVSYTQGVVGVQLTALTLQAKHALEGQVGTIHQILTAHNLQPGQIKVVTAVGGKSGANGAGARSDQAGFNFFSGGRKRQTGADEGTVGQA